MFHSNGGLKTLKREKAAKLAAEMIEQLIEGCGGDSSSVT